MKIEVEILRACRASSKVPNILINSQFFVIMIVLALIPYFYGYLNNADAVVIWYFFISMVLIPITICMYLLSLINFSCKVSGEKSSIYQAIDAIQFKYIKYFDVGFKVNATSGSGYIDNKSISLILSERYDEFLLMISICGLALLAMTLGEGNISTKPHFLISNFPILRSILACLGGYVHIWAFSLYIFGLFLRYNKRGDN